MAKQINLHRAARHYTYQRRGLWPQEIRQQLEARSQDDWYRAEDHPFGDLGSRMRCAFLSLGVPVSCHAAAEQAERGHSLGIAKRRYKDQEREDGWSDWREQPGSEEIHIVSVVTMNLHGIRLDCILHDKLLSSFNTPIIHPKDSHYK